MGVCTAATMPKKDPTDIEQVKKKARDFDITSLKMHTSHGNLANGALMRCMPLIVYGHKLPPDQLVLLMREDASLTHANAIGYYANATYAIAVQHLLNTQKSTKKREEKMKEAYNQAKTWLRTKIDDYAARTVYEWLRKAMNKDYLSNPISLEGFIGHAFQRSFYHLY